MQAMCASIRRAATQDVRVHSRSHAQKSEPVALQLQNLKIHIMDISQFED